MSNLVLTRKAGTGVRLVIEGRHVFVDTLEVTGGSCKMRVLTLGGQEGIRIESVRFRGEMQIAEGVTVTVLDLAKGHAKLGFEAPRDVQILRTELIKENEV